jgi:hypothetical protein
MPAHRFSQTPESEQKIHHRLDDVAALATGCPVKSIAFVSIAAFALLAGCASTPTSTTTVTSADVPPPAAREGNVRVMEVDPTTHYKDLSQLDATTHYKDVSQLDATKHFGARPEGDLVCHVTTREQGTVELYLTWKGGEGKGTLRRLAPSGNLTETKIHAERVQGAIVADDVLSHDLVVHAAMVKEHKGKKYVRTEESKTWVACE